MRRHSLTHRVLLLVVLVELLCAGCFSGVALWHEWRTRVLALDALLQGRSDSLLGAIQDAEDPADNVTIDPTELKLPSTDLYSVYNQDGVLLGGNQRSALPLTQQAGVGVRAGSFNRQSYRVLERKALRIIDREETGGAGIRRPVTIVYAIPISTARIWHETLEVAGFYILTSVIFTAFTVVILLSVMRGLLRPVEELAAAAAGVSPTSLVFRPPASAARVKELDPLLTALSSTIDGLRDAFERQHRFVGDAAHELKTAVAVVRSTIQVLGMRTRSVEEYEAGLKVTLRDNERVEELVGRMLLSADARQRSERPCAASDLASGVDQALQELGSYLLASNLKIQVSLAEGMDVPVSAEDVRTLVANLVVNAVQHSQKMSAIAVRVYRGPHSADSAVLQVEDHGEGIEARDMPFVFDRFYRADASRSRETGGVGLGLAICKNIVEAVGGQIALDSAIGRGTTATVTLPLAPTEL